ncbi:MAG: hypothetical protein ACFFAH_03890 [Promethearchaeota archaeon]
MFRILTNKLSLKPIITIDDFLNHCKELVKLNNDKILEMDFKLSRRSENQKINPSIGKAKLEDATKIAKMFKEIYSDSYPYKKMENEHEIKKMIKDPNYYWFLFKINNKEVVGCFGVQLEFDRKKGFLFGFVIRKKYQKIIDSLKTFIACAIFLLKSYKNRILIWYGEMRTNEAISQYATSLIGLKPVAFFPNKDIFLNQIESIVLHIILDDLCLRKYRYKKEPKIIRQVLNCYVYSNKRYNIGVPIIKNPEINYNQMQLEKIKKRVVRKIKKEKLGIETIKFYIKNSNSFFKFIYNPYSKNFEKTKYKIDNIFELVVFIQEVKNLIQEKEINYFECYVSSYKPSHQKVFYDAGFKPRGYVPCWKYNKKKGIFEDQIVFNYYGGIVDKNMRIIPETEELLKSIRFFEEKLFKKFLIPFQE